MPDTAVLARLRTKRDYECPNCKGEGSTIPEPMYGRAKRRECERCRGWGRIAMDAESALTCGALTDRTDALVRLINEGWPVKEAKEIVARWLL